VLGYLDVLRDKKPVGKTVAVIGAGGIGFDVSEYLLHEGTSPSLDKAKFFAEWGVDTTGSARGGLSPAYRRMPTQDLPAAAQDQQGGRRPGQDHRLDPPHGPEEPGRGDDPGVQYRKIDDAGLHITVDGKDMLAVDNVIVCAGQDPNRELQAALEARACACT
jgi:2,4-dienoyl-CoA reductase (NADPH2)